MYRLRAKVEIAERPELGVAAGSATALRRHSVCRTNPVPPARADGGVAMADPRLAALGARHHPGLRAVSPASPRGSRASRDFTAYDRHRLGLGVPDGSRDLVPDKSILLESGFDELNGVDWQKGCYVGQELTARTKYRGLIKKRLFPVRIDGATPRTRRRHQLGRQGSRRDAFRARDGMGLALLRLEAVAEDRPLSTDFCEIIPLRPSDSSVRPRIRDLRPVPRFMDQTSSAMGTAAAVLAPDTPTALLDALLSSIPEGRGRPACGPGQDVWVGCGERI